MPVPRTRFSIGGFLLQVIAQLGALCLVLRFVFPSFWARQVSVGIGQIILVAVIVHLGLCFFEWGFHRYVLHGTIHPWLARFSRGHGHHHDLTPIRLDRVPGSPDRYVLNRYPILKVEQYEDSAFPVYALVAFWVFFTPLLIGVQLLLPHTPIMVGGYLAIAVSMTGYEVFHAIEHFDYEWWKHAVESRRFGWVWKKLYGFHHYHHANIAWNEAISGFFGLPVADWVFRTYHQPQDLLLEGRVATVKDFHPPVTTWRFVCWLDAWARGRQSAITHRQ